MDVQKTTNKDKADISNLRHLFNLLTTAFHTAEKIESENIATMEGMKEIKQDIEKAKLATKNELSSRGDK
jgi:hypothetical protein